MTTRVRAAARITAQVAGEEVVMQGGSRRGSHPQAKGKANGRDARPRAAQAGPLPDSDRLMRALEPVVHAMDMDLESIRVTSAGRRRVLRVVVDADGGVSLDEIALASRELSARLDSGPEMGEQPYTLEVSSPGIDRPLTQPRHWRRARHRAADGRRRESERERGRPGRGPHCRYRRAGRHPGAGRGDSGVQVRRARPRPGPGRVRSL
jgi:ribosome maturation factor RimP